MRRRAGGGGGGGGGKGGAKNYSLNIEANATNYLLTFAKIISGHNLVRHFLVQAI